MNDGELLLRAILSEPAEDTPRLAYADYLEENGEGERAEFIRIQCRADREIYFEGAHRRVWTERELELLTAHSAAWRRPPCVSCAGKGYQLNLTRRVRQQCWSCNGTGSTGPLSERKSTTTNHEFDWKHAVTYVRGFPVVGVPFAEMGVALPTGHPWNFYTDWLAWAVRCVRECGASFKVQGKEAYWHGKSFCWYDLNRSMASGAVPQSAQLPTVIFDRLRNKGGRLAEYGSILAASVELDASVTSLVVERAYPVEVAEPARGA